jgi:hypothetical protein
MRRGGASNQQNAAVAPHSTVAPESTAAAWSLTATTAPQPPTAEVSPSTAATHNAPAANPSDALAAASAGASPATAGSTVAAPAQTVEASSTPASTAGTTSELQPPLATPSPLPRRAHVARQTQPAGGPSKRSSTLAPTDHRSVAGVAAPAHAAKFDLPEAFAKTRPTPSERASDTFPIGDAEHQASVSAPSPAVAGLAASVSQEPAPGGGSAVIGESISESRIPAASPVAPAAPAIAGSGPAPTVSSVAGRAVLVSSTDRSVYWALEDSGTIFRSTDRKSWQKQDSGVQSDLMAGQAVSNTVCWVVGRNGTILLTTDGTRWQRIKSPTTADLVSVSATSADVADIAAVDGSGFSTFDRGSNWQPSN